MVLPAAGDLDKQLKTFVDAFAIVEANAADPINSQQAFYTGAIPGLLKTLDPHSVFFEPGQFDQLKKMESSTQKGFGTIVSIMPGRVVVIQSLPGTPSAKSGMMPGDEIMAINNYVAQNDPFPSGRLYLAGRTGDFCRSRVLRPSEPAVPRRPRAPAGRQSRPRERSLPPPRHR